MEPDDLVSTMVLVCLKRHRNWPEKMTLEKYLGMVMLSVLRHLRREEASRRQDADEAMDERSGPSSHRDEKIDTMRRIEAIEKAIGDDAALQTMFRAGARGRQARRDRRDHRLVRRTGRRRAAQAEPTARRRGFLHEDEDERSRRARSTRKATPSR